jgi:hypothetical protein
LTISSVIPDRDFNIIRSSPRKSSSLDPLPTWLLYRSISSLIPAITAMVNLALQVGLPSVLKQACVTPILKKAGQDRNVMSNYRPVSNLPYISKVIERVVAHRLTSYLDCYDLWDSRQSAYRRFHSCETALVSVIDTAYSAMDGGHVTLLVLLDLSAAFDTVDHNLLLGRLQALGVTDSALGWFSSYLSNRSQSVVIGGTNSSYLPISNGVPQGSVLGPLLFSIYMIGLSDIISGFPGINYMLYADDIQLYITTSPSELSVAAHRMEACILRICDWLSELMLVLNLTKTDAILLGTQQQLKKCELTHLTVCESSFT